MINGDDKLPDDQVLNRLRNEPELIRVLWARYAQRVSRHLSKRVGQEAAEDLLSEVFVAALDARKRVVGHFFCPPPGSGKATTELTMRVAGPLAASVEQHGSTWVVAVTSNAFSLARYEVVRHDGDKYCVDRTLGR